MDENVKSEIMELLKAEGLDLAEEEVKLAVEKAYKVLKAVLPKVSPLVAGIAIPVLELVRPELDEKILDKIDGQVG